MKGNISDAVATRRGRCILDLSTIAPGEINPAVPAYLIDKCGGLRLDRALNVLVRIAAQNVRAAAAQGARHRAVQPAVVRRTPGRASSPSRRAPARTHTRRDDPGRPSSAGDEPPPQSSVVCGCGCGLPLPRGKRGYVDDAHSNRARQRRHKARRRRAIGGTGRDELLDLYAGAIAAARRRGVLDAYEALVLQAVPSDRVRAALAVRELVARTLAALDSGRMDVARRAAGPIASAVFAELEASR